MKREEVYEVFDSERDYQDEKWEGTKSSGSTSKEGGSLDRTIDEFILYIQGYTNNAVYAGSHFADARMKLDIIRKIGGLCVACGEAHGMPKRILDSYKPLPGPIPQSMFEE